MISFSKFKDLVQKAGLKAVDFGNNHWQIQTGIVLVNYYPTTKTVFVNGTTKGMKGCSVGKAIEYAKQGPDKATTKAKRLPSYSNHKKRLLKINPRCRWCGALLNDRSATIDHIIPLGKGGTNMSDNLTLACVGCNTSKADSMEMLQEEAAKMRTAF